MMADGRANLASEIEQSLLNKMLSQSAIETITEKDTLFREQPEE